MQKEKAAEALTSKQTKSPSSLASLGNSNSVSALTNIDELQTEPKILSATSKQEKAAWATLASKITRRISSIKAPRIELQTDESNSLGRSRKDHTVWVSTLAYKIARRISFSHIHLAYFSILSCFGSLLLWLLPKPRLKNLKFIDAMFNAVSALSLTGLSSVNIQDWSTGDQVCILLMTILDSIFLTSLFPIYMKRFDFKQRQTAAAIKSSKFNGTDLSFKISKCSELASSNVELEDQYIDSEERKAKFETDNTIELPSDHSPNQQLSTAHHDTNLRVDIHQKPGPGDNCLLRFSHRMAGYAANFSCRGLSSIILSKMGKYFISANSALDDIKFTSLREMEAEAMRTNDPSKLRIVENEAIYALSWVVLMFSVITQLVGFVFMEIYLLCSPTYLEALRERKVQHVFFAFSTSVGAFTNSGVFFINDNFLAFRKSAPILLCVSLQSVVGNTLFAPTIRAIIMVLHRVSKAKNRLLYEYLLTHPRKCYTHLFPHKQTIWLVITVMSFTAVQTFFFLLFDWNFKGFEGLTTRYKLLDGFFQSVTTRNAGGMVVNLGDVSVAMLVLYTGMMYIAVYPVYLTRQSSRARNLESGLHFSNPPNYYWRTYSEQESGKISVQFKELFARDSAYLFVAIFVLCISESSNINHDPLNYSIFNIFFEVISAYGNIGLSVGYSCKLRLQPDASGCEDVSYSFSGKWSTSGKILLIIVMILGRHRVLPDEADEAARMSWRDPRLDCTPNYIHTVSNMPESLEPISGNKSIDAYTIPMCSSISIERSTDLEERV
ncbi:hypothetical protein O6H91_16G018300 [Diphasiastrum complanatum]|uniref:Uncharacterized protein n=2 Tax=Diphasiastrum complanatum TaxID=34168 RepID=A0ACC2BBA5_DIPCM|nr:hypothetical protein O6H91_16G018300 [Diphasiastrum complanatum]KAJ7526683.1 hypothetical protein O6H91_16G018300 [Diphasiastrum complanatum]